jgi:cytochrome c-type biogenesis protein CcmH/NrfG
VDRRTFLALGGTIAAGLWIPGVRMSPLAAEALHRRTRQTAAGARSRGPVETHRPQEAEAALSQAIATRPSPATSLVVLAKVKVDIDDVDAAAAALEDAFLVARAAGDARAAAEARAVATDLPDCAAVRSLRELLRS